MHKSGYTKAAFTTAICCLVVCPRIELGYPEERDFTDPYASQRPHNASEAGGKEKHPPPTLSRIIARGGVKGEKPSAMSLV